MGHRGQQPADLATRPAWLHAAWERHRAWVPALLLAHKPKWADLDDLVQEVALQVVRKGSEVRDEAAFAAWLRVVAINVARVAARKGPQSGWRGIRAVLGFGSTEDQDAACEDDVAQRLAAAQLSQHAHRVLAIASKIDDAYREPLLLKAVHGMSYREIGVVMGLPESTIETRVARGRKRLRELLEQESQVEKSLAALMK